MFGRNPLRKILGPSDTLWVQEIFPTIQGEGPLAGMPAVFIRLAGCNLACTFCDTEFESSEWHPKLAEVADEVVGVVREYAISLVVITGGEPMRQDIEPLVRTLLESGYTVQIETAGTIWRENLRTLLQSGLSFVISPKTGKVAPEFHDIGADWKYIIRQGAVDDFTGLPNKTTQANERDMLLARPQNSRDTIWLQACDEHDAEKTRANVLLATQLVMKHGYRLSVQIHKIIGLP
jgi:7-carboxy-7-deazaguanine synthase